MLDYFICWFSLFWIGLQYLSTLPVVYLSFSRSLLMRKTLQQTLFANLERARNVILIRSLIFHLIIRKQMQSELCLVLVQYLARIQFVFLLKHIDRGTLGIGCVCQNLRNVLSLFDMRNLVLMNDFVSSLI